VAAASITNLNRPKRTKLVATYNKHLAEYEASFAAANKDRMGDYAPKWTFAVAQAVADGLVAEFKLRQQVVDEDKKAGEEVDAAEARAVAEKGEFLLLARSSKLTPFLILQLFKRSVGVSTSLTSSAPRRQRHRGVLSTRMCAAVVQLSSPPALNADLSELSYPRSQLVLVHEGLVSFYVEGDVDRTKAEERLKQAREELELEKKEQK